jgi:exodeoxyribonuclease VII large subunit
MAMHAEPNNSLRAIRLSEWTKGFEGLVQTCYADELVWIEADVGSCHVHPRSGHAYFDLVEIGHDGMPCAKMRANLWRNTAQRVLPEYKRTAGVDIAVGQRIQILIKPTYNPVFGLAFTALDLSPAGESAHEARRAALKCWAQQQPWWGQQAKLSEPSDVRSVILLTPKSAAGGEDAWKALEPFHERGIFNVQTLDIAMQGPGVDASWQQAFDAVARIHEQTPVDVVLVVRGGGASLDVTALESRATIEAVATCPIPVWTGIGHERDETLVDQAGNRTWGTPSKAANGVCELAIREALAARKAWEAVTKAAKNECVNMQNKVAMTRRSIEWQTQRLLEKAKTGASSQMNGVKRASLNAHQHTLKNTQALMQQVLTLGPKNTMNRGYMWVEQGQRARATTQELEDGAIVLHGKDGAKSGRITFDTKDSS